MIQYGSLTSDYLVCTNPFLRYSAGHRPVQAGHLFSQQPNNKTGDHVHTGLFRFYRYNAKFWLAIHQRPYHVESTGSRPITEVKQRRARLVLGWVTAWEHRVLLVFLILSFSRKLNKKSCFSFRMDLSFFFLGVV